MKNTLSIFIIIITIIVIMGGCTTKKGDNNSLAEEDIGLTDAVINGEVQVSDKLTLVELKKLLDTSTTVEIKNIDNQTIGKINTSEKINKAISDIFAHTAVDNYGNSSDENVVATVSFYIPGNEPIYGLIKERFIYIEGYYFTSKNNSIQKILEYFEANTEEEPIVFD